MATMTVSLPEQMKDWVESLTKNGEYSSSSDYVRDLIRRDKGKRGSVLTSEELEQLLEDSFSSKVSKKTIREIFNDAEKSANAKIENIA